MSDQPFGKNIAGQQHTDRIIREAFIEQESHNSILHQRINSQDKLITALTNTISALTTRVDDVESTSKVL